MTKAIRNFFLTSFRAPKAIQCSVLQAIQEYQAHLASQAMADPVLLGLLGLRALQGPSRCPSDTAQVVFKDTTTMQKCSLKLHTVG